MDTDDEASFYTDIKEEIFGAIEDGKTDWRDSDSHAFSLIKKTSILINTSRRGVINHINQGALLCLLTNQLERMETGE